MIRIITNAGTVDFAKDMDEARSKLKMYKNLVDEGYSKFVRAVREDREGRTIEEIAYYTKDGETRND